MIRRPPGSTVIAIAWWASVTGCTRAARPTPESGDASPVVTLERGACRGRCPEYRVQLFESGTVLFTGQRNVSAMGTHSGTASVADVRELLRTIAASEFASLDTLYTYGSRSCGQYNTDLPAVIVAARVGSQMKTVHHDPGCLGAPTILKTIAARVDTIAGTSKWIAAKEGGAR